MLFMKTWVRKLTERWLQLSKAKWGSLLLFICAFADASIFPMFAPVLLVALALSDITKTYKYSLIAIAGTFTGALAGYSIGHFAWFKTDGELTALSEFMLTYIPGFTANSYDKIHVFFDRWDIWILSLASSLPIPYKYFSISSGVFNLNILLFGIVTLIVQSLKFLVLGFLINKLGTKVKRLMEINWKPVIIIAVASIALILIVTKIF